MSKRQILMIVGVWVAILLYLGFPKGWDRVLLILTGLLIIFIAYRLKPGSEDNSPKKSMPESTFVDYHSPVKSEPTNNEPKNNPSSSAGTIS